MTISPEYLEQQKRLHENPNYGVASLKFAPLAIELAEKIGAKSISDYGAGKKNLFKRMTELGHGKYDYRPYDPAFPEYGPPRPADLVCCIDVLEHIEPEHLDAVLDELQRITEKVGLFSIHTGPAAKVLADGRNAHLIQKPASWWMLRICSRFEISHLQRVTNGFWIVVERGGTAASGA